MLVIDQVGRDIQVLAKLTAKPHRSARQEVHRLLSVGNDNNASDSEDVEVIVAVRRGNIFATAFHPELTKDLRWHRYELSCY